MIFVMIVQTFIGLFDAIAFIDKSFIRLLPFYVQKDVFAVLNLLPLLPG